jgi:succinate dehydrogenase / fumarate reductase, flavoprotein subunit
VPKQVGDKRKAREIPDSERDYYLERRYPSFGNLVPRDVASRAAKSVCDEGRGVGHSRQAVFLDFEDSIKRLGRAEIQEKYGNLFEMYQRITDENPYEIPMRIYPAPHYTMGGLWVDYNLMTTVPGLFAVGEANFSDHGANRLGASALMQGLADGYFVLPYTIADFIAGTSLPSVSLTHESFRDSQQFCQSIIDRLLSVNGNKTVTEFHRKLGRMVWDGVGMSRKRSDLENAIREIHELKNEFWQNVKIVGEQNNLNPELEQASRVADFFELSELMARDALEREESCGCHFREEHQTPDGEALRNDDRFMHVAVWEYAGEALAPKRHVEPLKFEYAKPSQRNYK